jgi:hypothetical protein
MLTDDLRSDIGQWPAATLQSTLASRSGGLSAAETPAVASRTPPQPTKFPACELSRMNERSSLVTRMCDWTVAQTIRAWHATLRLHIDAEDPSLDPRFGSRGNIYCMWHEDLVFLGGLIAHTGAHVVISRSRDGQRIARVMQQLGFQPIRGSSSRGGANAAPRHAVQRRHHRRWPPWSAAQHAARRCVPRVTNRNAAGGSWTGVSSRVASTELGQNGLCVTVFAGRGQR